MKPPWPASRLPETLVERAAHPYRALGLQPWLFARGKLGRDPAFAGLLRLGLIPSRARLLDLGCGQGLLAALLHAAEADRAAPDGDWPTAWPPAPRGVRLHGIDAMARDVRLAHAALAAPTTSTADGTQATFEQADIRGAGFMTADVVVLLDVLHYLDFEDQRQVLARVRDCLAPHGTLLLRVADADAGRRFRFSRWVDRAVLVARGVRDTRLFCRPLAQWRFLLETLGFDVGSVPMHAGTPFANLLLIGRVRAVATPDPEPAPA